MRAFVVTAALLAGCSAATNDPGLDSLMRVRSAQFYRGTPPGDTSGPSLSGFANDSDYIIPGQISAGLSGLATPDTGSVAIYLDGDVGYWIVLPAAADATQGNQLTWNASLSFSQKLKPGMYKLYGRAVGLNGKFGPSSSVVLTARSQAVTGTLVFSLDWDVNADLDLRVVQPGGTEIWAKHISSYMPPNFPGDVPDGGGPESAGLLDFDSNAQCVIDGRRRENIYWTVPPPKGHYIARVDTFSLCGQSIAYWHVTATLDGNLMAEAHGFGRDTDAAMPHEQGAGTLAVEIDVP
jgi:hypothetical protein